MSDAIDASLSTIFMTHLAAPPEERGEVDDLEDRLTQAVALAQHAWPGVQVPAAAFVQYIAERCQSAGEVAYLEPARLGELYLACGCCRGDARAMVTLETTYAPAIRSALARVSSSGLAADELQQVLRVKLFVGTSDTKPAISQYGGRGALGTWLRVTAVRVALNLIRGVKPTAPPSTEDRDFELLPALMDPELDFLKSTYREAFKRSFADAVGQLTTRQRMLLRQSLIERLNVRQIGRIYGIHAATAARWLSEARSHLVLRTREAVERRIKVPAQEFETIMGMIQSQLDLSVARLLDPQDEAARPGATRGSREA